MAASIEHSLENGKEAEDRSGETAAVQSLPDRGLPTSIIRRLNRPSAQSYSTPAADNPLGARSRLADPSRPLHHALGPHGLTRLKITTRASRLMNFGNLVGPDPKPFQNMGSERVDERYVGGVATACNNDPADP